MYKTFKLKHAVNIVVVFVAVVFAGAIGIGNLAKNIDNMQVNGTEVVQAAVVSWGLKFRADGKAPDSNASAEYLAKFDSYYVNPNGEKVIYLTFDAGFEAGHTEKILDTLKVHGVKACFFIVGNYIETRPDLVRRMCAEGHIVGNHTYNHPDMSAISDFNSFRKEIESLEKHYKDVIGEDISKFYRPPGGKFSEENLKHAKQLGYKTIFWSLAYNDWYQNSQPTKDQAFSKLLPRIHPGAIVLLHITSATNAEILGELITKWENMGYSFGTLDQLG